MINIDWTAIIVACVTFLGSAGMWTFLDHRQQRRMDLKTQENEMLKELKEIRTEVSELREIVDENEAKASRIRILKFADDLFMEANPSKDSFSQCLSDATYYEQYCKGHPGFKNHQTAETIEYITEIYHERMKKHDFARYGANRNGGAVAYDSEQSI